MRWRPTVAVTWSQRGIHDFLVHSFDSDDAAENRVDVRQGSHHGRPDQSPMIVVRRLRNCEDKKNEKETGSNIRRIEHRLYTLKEC